MKTTAFLLTMLVPAVASAQQKPTTGYAPVNGLKRTTKSTAAAIRGVAPRRVHDHHRQLDRVDRRTFQDAKSDCRRNAGPRAHGRHRSRYQPTKTSPTMWRRCSTTSRSRRADLIGYSMGGGVAMQCAIRHPEKVRKVVSISAVFRRDGWVKEAHDAFPKLTAEAFKGSPIEAEYKKLSPTPDEFPNFVKRDRRDRLRNRTTSAPTSSRPPKRRCSSSTAMPTACGSSTSRKCTA